MNDSSKMTILPSTVDHPAKYYVHVALKTKDVTFLVSHVIKSSKGRMTVWVNETRSKFQS